MLALQSDMPLPKDIDRLSIEVLVRGVRQHWSEHLLGPTQLQLPGTLALVAGSDPSSPVTVRVAAWQRTRLRLVRDVVTTVPTDRIALLQVTLEWLCDGMAREGALPGTVQSTCPDGETCIGGECLSNVVDSSKLPDYQPGKVYGDGGTPASGACFDVLGCFESASIVPIVDRATCVIDRPSGGLGANVAMVLAPSSDGTCSKGACLVPLDGFSDTGWTAVGDRLQLPPAVCKRIDAGRVAGIAVTTACPTKTASFPICGPGSSVPGGSSPDGGIVVEAGDTAAIDGPGPATDGATDADGATDVDGGADTCPKATCGGKCVDTGVDPAHCSACGIACAKGESCVASGCVGAWSFPTAKTILFNAQTGTKTDLGAGGCATYWKAGSYVEQSFDRTTPIGALELKLTMSDCLAACGLSAPLRFAVKVDGVQVGTYTLTPVGGGATVTVDKKLSFPSVNPAAGRVAVRLEALDSVCTGGGVFGWLPGGSLRLGAP